MPRLAAAFALTALGALAAWLQTGTGFANYDTAYTLVWGADLAAGRLPDYEVSLAPTPHPLATLGGLLLAPLGADAEGAVVVGAFLWLGALGAVAFALGAEWFGPWAGALAAAVLLTREPVLSFGARAYVDVPYLVLVLGALLVEARRPRAGAPAVLLLVLAGLLRPEAWLLSGAYLVWLAADRDLPRRRLGGLVALAALAPGLWALSDLLIAGSPLYSLTGTREGAELLGRRTGLDDVPLTVPRRLGEILREPVLLAAAVGGVLVLALQRERARLPVAAGLVAITAFCVLAAAGLPILGRYLLLPAALLATFCGAGALGWLRLSAGHPWRGRWRAIGVLALLALVAFIPRQVERIGDLRSALRIQREIRDDLRALARAPAFAAADRACSPVTVPNHRPVPHLALWLDRRPREIVSARLGLPRSGLYLDPAGARVERNYVLDPNDPVRTVPRVPPGFRRVAGNRSWVLYSRCPPWPARGLKRRGGAGAGPSG
jgi:hypothetical protein